MERNTTIESKSNDESMHNNDDEEEEDEKSRTSSSTTTKTTTTTSYSTSHLNSLFDDFSYQDSTVPRPVHHDGEHCMCYENREDCTTCSTQCTSEIFLLTSSESVRSEAGSSSSSSTEDGSSLEDDSTGFSLTSISLGSSEVFSEGCSEVSSEISTLQLDDYDQLVQSLHNKSLEFNEEFNKNSTTFGQLMALHGFQRAVLDDRLLDLDRRISSINTEAPPTTTITTETEEEEFDELDVCHLLLNECQMEHVEVRRCYLESLMDEDLMKSNQVRIQEMTEKLSRMTVLSSPSPPPALLTPSEEEYLDGILDDVSTCQSFCLDDL
ncbi:unnamed protein product [Caenorhabditis brenneri]